jgi:hypothetical protein
VHLCQTFAARPFRKWCLPTFSFASSIFAISVFDIFVFIFLKDISNGLCSNTYPRAKKIERILEKIERGLPEREEWISEDEAMVLLGKPGKPLARGTLYNKVQAGKILTSFYTISPVTGKRFYSKQKSIGL